MCVLWDAYDAIENGAELEIVYLKNTDEKTVRVIRPVSVGMMNYRGRNFLGLSAYCCLREELRTFRVDRILQVRDGDTVYEDEGSSFVLLHIELKGPARRRIVKHDIGENSWWINLILDRLKPFHEVVELYWIERSDTPEYAETTW